MSLAEYINFDGQSTDHEHPTGYQRRSPLRPEYTQVPRTKDKPHYHHEIRDTAELYHCNYCKAYYPPEQEYKAGFCSADCVASMDAYDVLKAIDVSHEHCSNCYLKLKEIYPPGRKANSPVVHYRDDVATPDQDPTSIMSASIPDCAIGRAYPHSHTLSGSTERLRPSAPINGDWRHEPLPHAESLSTSAVCSCGVTHHRTIHRPLNNRALTEYATNLSRAADELLSEEQHEHTHDRTILTACLEQWNTRLSGPLQQRQLIRALGYAIHGWQP